jgi:hypothetical protein
MWNEISRWLNHNHFEITWFIIGWLALATLDNLVDGKYGWALFNAFLLWANYKLRKVF